jgi:hypothetical protein
MKAAIIAAVVVAVVLVLCAVVVPVAIVLLRQQQRRQPSSTLMPLHDLTGEALFRHVSYKPFSKPLSGPSSATWKAGRVHRPPLAMTAPVHVWTTGPFSLLNRPKVLHDALKTWVARGPRGLVSHWFDDSSMQEYIARHFPGHLQDYNNLVPGAYRADLWRLLVLLREGGLYADSGVHIAGALKDVQSFWDQYFQAHFVMIDDHNPDVSNSVFQGVLGARSPGHPLLAEALGQVTANIRGQKYGRNALDITGPCAVGAAITAALDRANPEFLKTMRDPVSGHWRPGMYDCGPTLGTILVLRYRSRLVLGTTGALLFDTKVPSYYETLYGQNQHQQQGQQHYRTLWDSKQVFRQAKDHEKLRAPN